MSGTTDCLDALADALEAAGRVLRARATDVRSSEIDPSRAQGNRPIVDRVRSRHQQLGPRQAQAIEVLAEAGVAGTTTGVIARRISYDQPNVYLTLQALIQRGIVERDVTTNPHTYRLSSEVLLSPESRSTT